MEAAGKEGSRVLIEGGEGEIEEKKSRFIATVAKVETEEEATAFLDSVKKKYWDASHNCSAFIIGAKNSLTRCSDDGEPAGTAGRPMLEVLMRERICNAAVVVTRYFGGTLLGTGGLVRAYTQAVKEGLSHCKIGVLKAGVRLKIETDYNGIGKILYLLGARGNEPEESEYGENVRLLLLVPEEEEETLIKDMTEATSGRVRIEILERLSYIDKEEGRR